MPPEHELSAARVLRPDRPRLSAARAALAGLTHPREAWEVLAAREVIPADWVGAPERTFVHGTPPAVLIDEDSFHIDPWVPGPSWRETDHPASVQHAMALGADPVGLLTAETLAREVAARLAPWNFARPARIRWHVAARTAPTPFPSVRRWGKLGGALWMRTDPDRATWPWTTRRLRRAADERIRSFEALRAAAPPRVEQLAIDLEYAARWSLAHELGAPFRELPSPFEPLLAIWQLGYALDDVNAGAIVLVAPALDDEG